LKAKEFKDKTKGIKGIAKLENRKRVLMPEGDEQFCLFFFWPLCFLSFNLRLFIIHFASSSFSYIIFAWHKLDQMMLGSKPEGIHRNYQQIDFDFCCLMPLSAIFQLYHGDHF
jgi:hypothetical protein